MSITLDELMQKITVNDDVWEASIRDELAAIGSPLIPYLLDVLRYENWQDCQRSESLLKSIGSEVVIPILEFFLTSPIRGQGYVSSLLIDLKDERVIDPLMDYVQQDNLADWAVNHAFNILKIFDSERIIAFFHTLMTKPNYPYKGKALVILGELGATQHADEITRLLRDPNLRLNAALALAHLKDKRSYKPMVKLLKSKRISAKDKTPLVKQIGELGDPYFLPVLIKMLRGFLFRSGFQKLLKAETRFIGFSNRFGRFFVSPKTLLVFKRVFKIETLKQQEERLVWELIETLGKVGDERAVDVIVRSVFEDFEYSLVFEALAQIGSRKAIERLILFLGTESIFINRWGTAQEKVIEILVEKGKTIVEPLIEALKTSDETKYHQSGIVEVLCKIGDPRAVEPILEAFHRNEKSWRAWSIGAERNLGKLKDPRIMNLVLDGLRDESLDGYSAIPILADACTLDQLIELTEDANFYVKGSAIAALGKHKNEDIETVISTLKKFADDEIWGSTACEVAYSLDHPAALDIILNFDAAHDVHEYDFAEFVQKHGGKSVVPLLIERLKDTKFKSDYVYSLALIGDKRAIEPLYTLRAKESDENLRYIITRSLAMLGDEPAFRPYFNEIWTASTNAQEGIIKTLAKHRTPLVVELLSEYLLNPQDRLTNRSGIYMAVNEISKLGVGGYETLLLCLKSSELRLLSDAISAIRPIFDPDQTVQALIPLLEDNRRLNEFQVHRISDVAVSKLDQIATPEALKISDVWKARQPDDQAKSSFWHYE